MAIFRYQMYRPRPRDSNHFNRHVTCVHALECTTKAYFVQYKFQRKYMHLMFTFHIYLTTKPVAAFCNEPTYFIGVWDFMIRHIQPNYACCEFSLTNLFSYNAAIHIHILHVIMTGEILMNYFSIACFGSMSVLLIVLTIAGGFQMSGSFRLVNFAIDGVLTNVMISYIMTLESTLIHF